MDYILIPIIIVSLWFVLITTCGEDRGATFYVECLSTEDPLECCTKYTEILRGKKWDAPDFMFGCLKGNAE